MPAICVEDVQLIAIFVPRLTYMYMYMHMYVYMMILHDPNIVFFVRRRLVY